MRARARSSSPSSQPPAPRGRGQAPRPSPVHAFALANGLAARTQREPRFRDIFYEAQYNSAKCKLLQSQTLKGKEKTTALEGAAGTLTLTATAHPDLGGGDWGKKYNDLLKAIQTASGKQPTGLPVAKPAANPKETAAGGAAK